MFMMILLIICRQFDSDFVKFFDFVQDLDDCEEMQVMGFLRVLLEVVMVESVVGVGVVLDFFQSEGGVFFGEGLFFQISKSVQWE